MSRKKSPRAGSGGPAGAGSSGLPPPWLTLAESPKQRLPDIGPEVLDNLYRTLMVDDEWAIRNERSFTWWAYRLAQHVEVSDPRLAFGDPEVAVRVSTDTVREIRASTKAVEEVINEYNKMAALNALVWSAETRTARLTCTVYLHAGNRGLERLLSLAALVQTTEAHGTAESLADVLQGQPFVTTHPTSGERPDIDDLLGFVQTDLIPGGKGPSAFTGDQLLGLERAQGVQWVVATSSPTGMTGELAFNSGIPAGTVSHEEKALVSRERGTLTAGYGSRTMVHAVDCECGGSAARS